ncbi:MAG: peptidoglycan-binding protein [Patescibacteria group bacterium]|nr:peptidoglycan-binding protein [Patescibacteria group bacterium]
MKKYLVLFVSVLVFSVVFMVDGVQAQVSSNPTFVGAVQQNNNISAMQTQLQALTQQLQAIQNQLQQSAASGQVVSGSSSQGGASSASPVNSPSQFSQSINFGSQGDQVLNLQNELQDLHFFPADISPTGYFGPITQKAVSAFQSANNLSPNGLMDASTISALQQSAASGQVVSGSSSQGGASSASPTSANPPSAWVNPSASTTLPVFGSPIISSISPSSGPVNTQVTITGSFTLTGNKVKFGSLDTLGTENNPSYTLNSFDGKTLVFTVPPGNYLPCWYTTPACGAPAFLTQPGVYGVSVTNANGTSNTVTFTVTALR